MDSSALNIFTKYRLALKVVAGIIFVFSSVLTTPDLLANGVPQKHCVRTAHLALLACKHEVKDDFLIAKANCINTKGRDERIECKVDNNDELKEARKLCKEQFIARKVVCGLTGEGRYDPDFNPANFVDPDAIGAGVAPNPYLPLIPGARWVYEGGDEVVTVRVTDKTKLIDGVTCRVVNDVVEDDGEVIEDTDDWYAQHVNGDVWYCGEIARDFETFPGDNPDEPELVEIEGSFKAGRDGDKPGILVRAAPQVGDVYRQEMSLGNAEDVAEVISITGTESTPAASCLNNCLVTRDFTPLEPEVEENKYYVPGVGLILETDEGDRTELVDFSIP